MRRLILFLSLSGVFLIISNCGVIEQEYKMQQEVKHSCEAAGWGGMPDCRFL